ncbi:LOG family protein [Candidatus Collierbacteria bacterium]|nr:LOG family protein [Candidatus Collierbacteria bacterium]
MEFKRIKSVSIFGYANAAPDSKLYKETHEVCRVLAEHGLTIINGGGPGVMRAATDGAHAGGGIAEVATFYPKFIENFEGKDPLNKADKEIILGNYVTRTMKLLEVGNAYIVFNGGTGTLSEFGMAWGLAYLYFGHHKPMILYGQQWHGIMESLVTNMLIAEQRPESLKVYKIATSPEAVLQALHEHDEFLGELREEVHAPAETGETAFID